MRSPRTAVVLFTLVAVEVAAALPALAQEAEESSAKPWHFWIAPVLLAGSVLVLVAIGVGYYVRVVAGRGRRG